MKRPLIAANWKFISYGMNPYSATVSVKGQQQTWYAESAAEPFTCLLTGLEYYPTDLRWGRPGSEDKISGEGMIKLSYSRFV